DEIIKVCQLLEPTFGGINLEDIKAPECFYIEQKLRERMNIPVFHDDQHGTAVVVLAALLNALKIVGKRMEQVRVVVSGAGAAGIATMRALREAGAGEIIGVDRQGALYEGRHEAMNPVKQEIARETNSERQSGSLQEVLRGADAFIGLSSPGLLTVRDLEQMAQEPIVFALANPVPEIMPEEAEGCVRVMATGRSDYPNQINNVLAFPGIFRGALDCQATTINAEMKLAAARAIADTVGEHELSEEYIIPSVFNRRVVEHVAEAVVAAAQHSGVARRQIKTVPEDEIVSLLQQ
ncbi:MAG: NAD-dependent malic enzyme, partial [Chloroflexota bacterium]|nr:NAD-dependent malic enzyme [Chloroflexota bacterium]